MSNQVCACCGVKWEDGKGFVEPHKMPCANARYGFNYTVTDKERDMEPKKYLAEWIDENGAIYDHYEFVAVDYTTALKIAHYVWFSNNPQSDLIVHRV